MFANILVPLDGSALSEHALPMAQHLARSSETVLHLLQVISGVPVQSMQKVPVSYACKINALERYIVCFFNKIKPLLYC